MRAPMSRWRAAYALPLFVILLVLCPWAARAQSTPLRFSLTVDGNHNVPRITVRNESRSVQIVWFEMTIGLDSKNFDAVYSFNPPPGGNMTASQPDADDGGGDRSNLVQLNLTS